MTEMFPLASPETVEVLGVPVAQGSTRAFAIRKGPTKRIVGVGTTNDTQGTLAKWRGDVRQATQNVLTLRDGPVAVSLRFSYRRPKSHLTPSGSKLRLGAPRFPALDLDKLARGVLDALTGIAYHDDKQVTVLTCVKGYDDHNGCQITIWEAP